MPRNRPRLAMRSLLGSALGSLLYVCVPSATAGDDELAAHLATLRQRVEDVKVAVEEREALALEMAATLDRAAQAATTADDRRARWAEAIRWLDDVRARYPDFPDPARLDFQAAVYQWAWARSWSQQGELVPTDAKARAQAIAELDSALVRLRRVRGGLRVPDDPFVQNVGYRLAQALADRAEFEPGSSAGRVKQEEEALQVLGPGEKGPALRGFVHLLRGELLGRLGRYDAALTEVEAAAQATPPPSPAELLETRLLILLGRNQFEAALKAIDAARLDTARSGLFTVQVRLAQRRRPSKGKERAAVESALFQQVARLRESGKPEARLALAELARGLDEPGPEQTPEAWDALAEGAQVLGDLERASTLETRGAARAAALGDAGRAARLRLKAGALLYQAEKFIDADALLSQVADDPKGGRARAKAGLLRCLARGRALALGTAGASQGSYRAALEMQLAEFPDDPATGEARWLLGKLKLALSERDAALALWSAIGPRDPRWLDARIAVARLNQDDLDNLRIGNDRALVAGRFAAAQRFLQKSIEVAADPAEKTELELELARLELTPALGHPNVARAICDRDELNGRARRLRIVALAGLNRYVEAERAARSEIELSRPEELLETSRLLDSVANESESDLRQRRFGLLMRILIERVLTRADDLSPEQRWEAQLRQTRAILFVGNTAAARRTLTSWAETPPPAHDRLLRDLADAYFRLEAFELAIDVQRLRSRQAATGSPSWFDARYGLALAYFRADRLKEARHLIDATAILHPDLGGGELREKFTRLRQRVGPEPEPEP